MNCIRRTIERKCTEEEVDDVIGFFKFFKLLTTSAVDLACNHLNENSVRCKRLTVTRKTKGVNKPKSFMFLFINVLNLLPESLSSILIIKS